MYYLLYKLPRYRAIKIKTQKSSSSRASESHPQRFRSEVKSASFCRLLAPPDTLKSTPLCVKKLSTADLSWSVVADTNNRNPSRKWFGMFWRNWLSKMCCDTPSLRQHSHGWKARPASTQRSEQKLAEEQETQGRGVGPSSCWQAVHFWPACSTAVTLQIGFSPPIISPTWTTGSTI